MNVGVLAWGLIGLIVAGLVAVLGGRKGFAWTLFVMWVLIPLSPLGYRKYHEARTEDVVARLRDEYARLCAAPDRERIASTARDVAEVAVWPQHGPRDGWHNDLFFRARQPADEWIVGRDAGRYGGFRHAKLLSPDATADDEPRYHVIFQELTAGMVDGTPRIRGLNIRIVDRKTGDVMAERRDYVTQTNFGFARGCEAKYQRGPGDEWFRDNLAFIHKVLAPPPGVAIIEKTLSPNASPPEKLVATLVRELPATETGYYAPRRPGLPPEIRFEPIYTATATDVRLTDRVLIIRFDDHDVRVRQGIRGHDDLIAMTRDGSDYIVLFRIDSDPGAIRLREFSRDGDLIAERRIELPESIRPVAFFNILDRKVVVEKAKYRVRVSLNPKDGKFEKDVELEFPRTRTHAPGPQALPSSGTPGGGANAGTARPAAPLARHLRLATLVRARKLRRATHEDAAAWFEARETRGNCPGSPGDRSRDRTSRMSNPWNATSRWEISVFRLVSTGKFGEVLRSERRCAALRESEALPRVRFEYAHLRRGTVSRKPAIPELH
jgi:hypothetical protein